MATKISPQEDLGLVRERITKEGRRLNYCLKVIQEPERARACGSGAKSSADRRPVDPPPVVRLSIYEGDPQLKNDVTFSYDANFFLFATLELARPMIHGRVQPSAQQIPVLTGMPVSGMAYLDRPHEAGYFIFPDLSVRHEGKYRLSFNLYEETKNAKDKDADESPDTKKPSLPDAANCPHGSFDWRMEIKSNQFTVYSAKKFPGLSESTSLSRTVAEQGCRVRIRRDVRMRRRDGKAGGDYDEYDEEYSRSRRTVTPDSVHDAYSRPRSLSNADADRQPHAPDAQRRASGVDYNQQSYPPNYGPSPVTPQAPAGGYLSFGGPPSQQYQPAQFAQPQLPLQPHQYQVPAQPTSNAPPPYRQAPTGYQPSERPPYSSQYPAQRENYEPEFRRPSFGYSPASSAPLSNQYPPTEQNYNRTSQPTSYPPQYPARAHSPVQQPPILAPLKMLDHSKYESLSSPVGGPLSATGRMAPSLPSPSYQDRPGSFSSYSASSEPARNNKRPYESVFSSSSYNQPLHNGMRPTSAHHTQASSSTFDDDDDSVSMEALRMQYKRADGTNYCRDLPILE